MSSLKELEKDFEEGTILEDFKRMKEM